MFFPDRQLIMGGFAKILLHADIKTVRSNYLGGSRYTILYPERGGVIPLRITWCCPVQLSVVVLSQLNWH